VLLAFGATSCFLSRDRYTNAREPVYILDTGIRYHLASCRYVTEDAEEVPLGYAVGQGFTPCPVCSPPRLEETEPDPRRDLRIVIAGAVILLFGVVVAPSIVRNRIYRSRATRVAKCKVGEDWRSIPRSERKRLIGEAIDHLEDSAGGAPPGN
jgi:hypothetical protein